MDSSEYGLAAQELFEGGQEAPPDLSALGPILIAEFIKAESDRKLTELRWLRDLRQFKGLYEPEDEAKMSGRSRVFVRKTRVKVKTVNARVNDLLFPAGSEKNWSIDPTPIPMLSQQQEQLVQITLDQMTQAGQPVDDLTINQVIREVANKAASKMSQAINDQLIEARYRQVSLQAIHSCHLYGTGIIKGPTVERRARTKFSQVNGKWVPKEEYFYAPSVSFVPLWDFYPDMTATELTQCRFVFQRHLMTAHDLAELADRPAFKAGRQAIKDYIKGHPLGQVVTRLPDSELRSIGSRIGTEQRIGQYEILERWGYLRGDQLQQIGVDVPESRAHEAFFSVVWLLPNGVVIMAALKPIDGVLWPFHLYQFDKDESSIFAEGLASIMRDDQEMINSSTRMLLDNGALASGPMFEVTPSLLSKYEDLNDVSAWKVWLRNGQSPGQRAVVPVSIDGRLSDLQGIKAMFEANADETTAIPRYMSGENASQGAAGTASGMSMLMGAANIVIKDLVANWDEGITRPFVEAMYRWNMRFNPNPEIKGDYAVIARGTSSLVAKEIRARQLNEFAAMTANPLDAPYIKRDKLNRLRAEANELSEIVKTEDEVKSEQAAQQNQQAQQLQEQMMQAQLQEAMGKAAKVTAEAELVAAKAKEAAANIELTMARAIDAKVEAIYAAIQAGGAAASSLQSAPAADEILRSAGFKDATADATIADLMTEEVQGDMPAMVPQQQANPATGRRGMRQGIQTAAFD